MLGGMEEDPKVGDPPLAELAGLQFGLLSNEDTLAMSVFEKNQNIIGPKTLWDSRLGVYFLTGDGSRCSSCGAFTKDSCDGHFGHIVLPMPVYHPFHVAFTHQILSKICIICYRLTLKKKESKVVLLSREEPVQTAKCATAHKDAELPHKASKHGAELTKTCKVIKIRKKLKTEVLVRKLQPFKGYNRQAATELAMKVQAANAVDWSSCGSLNSSRFKARAAGKVISAKLREDGLSLKTRTVSTALDSCATMKSSEAIEDGCKYCGADLKDTANRYPALQLLITKRREDGFQTITMKARCKDEIVPPDYWNFVHGHPGGSKQTRPLLPFEALKILRCIPHKVIEKLGMHNFVARPEALILMCLPVPPSCTRVKAPDTPSVVTKVLMDNQYRLLQAVVKKVRVLQSSRAGKPGFATTKNEVAELQVLIGQYLTGCKIVKGLQPSRFVTSLKTEKEEKLMKGHVLAKRNNISARCVVVGDPAIRIDQISVPIDLADYLTIPERVTALNIKQLQQYVDNGPHAEPFKTGAVWYGRGGVLLSNSTTTRAFLKFGDVIHRHLKEGDLIIVNRPPSLQKHSLMALHVHMHVGSVFGINPLICAPFGADFDGDSIHVFVPQSAEAMAEVHELLDVPSQLISSQGGQSNSGLTEDSRLGAHLMTSSFVFFGKAEMQQFTMWSSELLPIPAILKSPKGRGPLWTGAQLFSMTIPKQVDYRLPHRKHAKHSDKGILVRDGELLVCHGGPCWLDKTPDGIVVVICKSVGPTLALKHLNDASELSNKWLSERGFSLGLLDFQLARDVYSQGQMLMRVKEELIRANQEALIVSLISDAQVQKQELRRHPTNARGLSEDTVCCGSLGLFLGNARTTKQAKVLQKVVISRFQGSFGQKINSLAKDYRGRDNSLFAMIKAGSKGSFSKMVQQTVSLGLQLYKGDELLPFGHKLLQHQSLLKNSKIYTASDLLQARQGPPFADISGYWESRGIVMNSLRDGLSPLQLFLHAMASRYGIAREGVEEPNILLNNLLLFMRNLHVSYDGTVCEPQGQNIVQFEYGGLLESKGKAGAYKQVHGPDDWPVAGEPVGILAATAITEPAYQLKLDSPHQIGAKEISPLQLLRESLRAKTTMSLADHQILLRFPCGLRNRHHGEEKAAIKLEQHLKAITLDMLTLVTMIEYQKVGTKDDHIRAEKRSPWVARIQLSMEELRQHHISIETILQRLAKKFADKEGQKGITFFSTNGERLGPCIHFYPDLSKQIQTVCDDAVYEDTMSNILEAMKYTMLPIILQTTVKGDERIRTVKVVWEDRSWNPSALVPSTKERFKYVNGELVVEVTVKRSVMKTRGQAWEVVKEACLPIMETLDWHRSMPYSVQEIHQNLGVEAAKEVLLQRLRLAAAGMGQHLLPEHLKLIADSVTYCGEVMGATFPGFKALCTSTSISTPFTKAAFQDPKNMFLQAARNGSCEGMEGVITAAVCGKMAPCGTGAPFELQWQDQIVADCPVEQWRGVDVHEYIINIDSPVKHASQNVPSASMPKLHYEGHDGGLAHQLQSMTEVHHGADGSKKANLPNSCIDEPGISAIIEILIERAVAQASWCSQPLAANSNLNMSQSSKLHTGSCKCPWFAAARKKLKTLGDRDQASEDGHNDRKRKTDQEGGCVPITNSEFLVPQKHAGSPVSGTRPGARLSVCMESIAVNQDQCSDPVGFRPGSPDGSCSSFHTPTGTLEAHSGNSSPCSTFQELPHPATPYDRKSLEDDGLSSNSPSSLVRTQAKFFATHSCITTLEDQKFVAVSSLSNQEPTSGFIYSMKQAQGESAGSEHKTWLVKGDTRFEQAQQKLFDDTNVPSPHRVGRDGSSPFISGRSKWMQHTVQRSTTSSDNVAWWEDPKHSEEWEELLQLSNIAKSILHTRYQVGERLETQDQRFILEKVLRYHPFCTEKIGCGVHYIKVDHHDSHSKSRCFFVVRTDGTVCDFSYHKCIKGKANAKNPSLALWYDHKYCLNHGQDEIFEHDTFDSPHIDPSNTLPSWTPLALHGGQLAEGGP